MSLFVGGRRAGAALALRRAPAAVLRAPARRGAAGGEFADLKIKKNNFYEQNEVLRENKYMDWKLDGTTGTSLFVFLVVVPVAVNWALRSEMASRDKAEGIEEQARV